ncbi:hypothetical protein RRF57_005750 [Xylaria bambusicola]|uniref:Uncharacterized protein n=1 Tax=Xylaria bambusicola TaxID=326684 RepID=A0AAN7YY20_9PEZI
MADLNMNQAQARGFGMVARGIVKSSGLTVRSPRETVPTNLRTVTLFDAIVSSKATDDTGLLIVVDAGPGRRMQFILSREGRWGGGVRDKARHGRYDAGA